VNKIKRDLTSNRNLRFNNHPSALIFGSFHQGKEQRFHFKLDFHLFYFVAAARCIAKKGGAKNTSAKIKIANFYGSFRAIN
jgi:hypothetical protein